MKNFFQTPAALSRKEPVYLLLMAILLVMAAIFGAHFVFIPPIPHMAITSLFLLFAPGFLFSLIFFPGHLLFFSRPPHEQEARQSLDIIERIILSVMLSILVVSLVVYAVYTFQTANAPGWNEFRNILFCVVSVFIVIAFFRIMWFRRGSKKENCG